MNNMMVVGFTTMIYAFINQMALSLGITTTAIDYPDGLTEMGTTNVLELLARLPIWVINNIGSFLQLAFFTTDIPDIFSSLIFAPMSLMLIYLGVVTVRGGAS